METLAAACAEIGDFDSAIKWQTKANDLDDDEEGKAIGEALQLYQRESPSATTTSERDPTRLTVSRPALCFAHVKGCWWPGSAACRGRRTGNPVRIRNGPAAVSERQRVLPLLLPLLVGS